MKKIIILLLVGLSLGCNIGLLFKPLELYPNRVSKSTIFYDDAFQHIRSQDDIIQYINTISLSENIPTKWASPKEVFIRKEGTWEEKALLFINIYFIVFNKKCDLIPSTTSDEGVVKGGVVLPNKSIIDIETGKTIYTSPVLYLYYFDDLFYSMSNFCR